MLILSVMIFAFFFTVLTSQLTDLQDAGRTKVLGSWAPSRTLAPFAVRTLATSQLSPTESRKIHPTTSSIVELSHNMVGIVLFVVAMHTSSNRIGNTALSSIVGNILLPWYSQHITQVQKER